MSTSTRLGETCEKTFCCCIVAAVAVLTLLAVAAVVMVANHGGMTGVFRAMFSG